MTPRTRAPTMDEAPGRQVPSGIGDTADPIRTDVPAGFVTEDIERRCLDMQCW